MCFVLIMWFNALEDYKSCVWLLTAAGIEIVVPGGS